MSVQQNLTTVVNLRKNKYDVYIGRDRHEQKNGYFGNPFTFHRDGDRKRIIQLFRTYFYRRLKTDPIFVSKIEALKGKVLGCFCKPEACHGDIIAEYLNQKEDDCNG